MRKLQYIQPEVKAITLSPKDNMMQGNAASGGTFPGLPNEPGQVRRKDGTRAVF